MKEWYYIASDKPNEKNYFDTYDDTQFAIICIFRYKAPINDMSDDIIYGYGYYGGSIYESNGKYYMRYSIGSSCD